MPFANQSNPKPAAKVDVNNPPADKAYSAFWKPIRINEKTGEQLETGLTPVTCWDFVMDDQQYTLVEFTFANVDTGQPESRKMAFSADDTRIIRMGQLEFV